MFQGYIIKPEKFLERGKKKIFFHENSKYNYHAAINDTNTIVTNFTDIANFLNNYFREVADYVMVNQILQ